MPTPKRTIPSPGPAAPLERGSLRDVSPAAKPDSAGPGTSLGRPPRAEETAARELRIRCTDGERAVLDDVSGEQPTSTWARDVLMREAGRILAGRMRDEPIRTGRWQSTSEERDNDDDGVRDADG